MTNGDKIRAMTDEEIAHTQIYVSYFNDYDYDLEEETVDNWNPCYVCSDDTRFDSEDDAIEHEIDWLRQEAERSTSEI